MEKRLIKKTNDRVSSLGFGAMRLPLKNGKNDGVEKLIRREKGNIQQSKKDNDFQNFLDNFNKTKRANLLKEKLKKFIVNIVRENFGKKNQKVKGVSKNKDDQFYTELYAYLTKKIAKATDELVALKKDELHEDVIVSYTQSKKEINKTLGGFNLEFC